MQKPDGVFDPRWGEYHAEEWADAIIASMKLGGVEHLFFVSGSEIAFFSRKRRQSASPRLACSSAADSDP